MRILAWMGMALLSCSWLMGLGFYFEANRVLWWVTVVAGASLMTALPARPVHRCVAVVGLVLTLPAMVSVPGPWRAGPVFLFLGLALQALPAPRRWVPRLGWGLLSAGVVLILQSVGLFAYETFTARSPALPDFLVEGLAWLARILGTDATGEGANVVLFSMRTKHELAAIWGLLLDPVTFSFLVGGGVVIALTAFGRKGLKRLCGPAAALAAIMVVWLPVRALLMMAVYLHRVLRTDYDAPLHLADQFWSSWYLMPLILPPVLLAWRFIRLHPDQDPAVPDVILRKSWIAPALALAGSVLIILAVLWCPSGERKGGRILVDEYHCLIDDWSRWRWAQKDYDTTSTLKPFDRTWYGQASGYNYATIYEYCSRFYEMARQMKPIDDDALKACDVLLLKVPSRRFSEEEVAAILRFVQNGGGLLLMGEHTSVFGSGVCLNRIAREFGFSFRYDCLFGIDSVFRQLYTPPPVPHPVIQHMGPMEFAISCSIDPGLSPGRAVIRSTGLKSLGPDYFASNFYPQPENRPEMMYGSFVQLWTTRSGKGRVLAFTDSTIFANFSIFDEGKSELFLGMLEWLNHRPASSAPGWVLAVFGLVLAAAALLLARPCRTDRLLLVCAGLAGWVIAAWLATALHRAKMPGLEPKHPLVRVGLETSFCKAELPLAGFIAGKEEGFGIFERSVQRLTRPGAFPDDPGLTWTTFRADRTRALTGDIAVFIHPGKPYPREFPGQLAWYVKAGGHALVLDSPENKDSTTSNLLSSLKRFNLAVKKPEKPLTGTLTTALSSLPPLPIQSAFEVKGGIPLARLGDTVVAAWTRHGKGSLTLIGFGSRFSDFQMGVTGDCIPDKDLAPVYAFVFSLLEAIRKGELPGE